MDQSPICKIQNIKRLEENIGGNQHVFVFSDELLDRTPKEESISEKKDQLDFIKNKMCVLQRRMLRNERQTRDWKKIFAKPMSDNRIVSKYTKN